MKIVITGGAGFIGSALIRHILETSSTTKVVNIDKLTYAGNLESLLDVSENPNYKFVQADICDSAAIRSVLEQEDPDGIIHLAAESHVDRSIDGPYDFLKTNIVGTYTLLEEAKRFHHGNSSKTFRFHHVSTDEVYGSLGETGLFTESTRYDPSSPYSSSKASSDHLVRAWHRTFDLPTLITNCSNNYGPRQFPEKLIPLMILNALEGKELPVYGKGENIRDWLFVEDHASALWETFQNGKPGDTYNIGGNNEIKNLEVVEIICDILDELAPDPKTKSRRELIRFVQDRPGHDMRYAIDSSYIKKELGWEPKETFETGFRKTVLWYLENKNTWCKRVLDGSYKKERLGLS